MNIDYIGYTAVVIGAISTIPQLYQIIKITKRRLCYAINIRVCCSNFIS